MHPGSVVLFSKVFKHLEQLVRCELHSGFPFSASSVRVAGFVVVSGLASSGGSVLATSGFFFAISVVAVSSLTRIDSTARAEGSVTSGFYIIIRIQNR